MTLEPISIATKGYICNFDPDPIAIATKGYVCAPVFAGGGGDSILHRGRRGLDTSIDALLVREDEEVLAIIIAAARAMQWD